MFKPDPTAKVVFHVMRKDLVCGVLENYPHQTPRFDIERLPQEKKSEWRVSLFMDPDLGFTDTMTSRSDVLGYMLRAPRYVNVESASTVRESVTRLLMHWAEMFPNGVPDRVID